MEVRKRVLEVANMQIEFSKIQEGKERYNFQTGMFKKPLTVYFEKDWTVQKKISHAILSDLKDRWGFCDLIEKIDEEVIDGDIIPAWKGIIKKLLEG